MRRRTARRSCWIACSYYFREVRGFAYDEVNAVLAAGCDDLPDVEARLKRVKAVRPTEDFEPLAACFKRIRNILKQAEFEPAGVVDPALLEAGPNETCTPRSTRSAAVKASIIERAWKPSPRCARRWTIFRQGDGECAGRGCSRQPAHLAASTC